jgi:hypothetical protein
MNNSRGTVGGGDFYCVLPEVVKGGHARTLRQFKIWKRTQTAERKWGESSAVD